jgi:hypothetical protein
MTGLWRVAVRSFLLMRRMRMTLGLELFGLVWGTFAIPGHEVLQIRKPALNCHSTSNVYGGWDPSQTGRSVRRSIANGVHVRNGS